MTIFVGATTADASADFSVFNAVAVLTASSVLISAGETAVIVSDAVLPVSNPVLIDSAGLITLSVFTGANTLANSGALIDAVVVTALVALTASTALTGFVILAGSAVALIVMVPVGFVMVMVFRPLIEPSPSGLT